MFSKFAPRSRIQQVWALWLCTSLVSEQFLPPMASSISSRHFREGRTHFLSTPCSRRTNKQTNQLGLFFFFVVVVFFQSDLYVIPPNFRLPKRAKSTACKISLQVAETSEKWSCCSTDKVQLRGDERKEKFSLYVTDFKDRKISKCLSFTIG